MGRRSIVRLGTLVVVGVLGSSAGALAWNGNGNNNGWVNKQERGCPSSYVIVAASEFPIADLNGDGSICFKTPGASGENYIDNTSNH